MHFLKELVERICLLIKAFPITEVIISLILKTFSL